MMCAICVPAFIRISKLGFLEQADLSDLCISVILFFIVFCLILIS